MTMFLFSILCKRVQIELTVKRTVVLNWKSQLGFQISPIVKFSCSSSRKRNILVPKDDKGAKKNSFTVSYLVSVCGLSPEAAKTASKKIHFRTPERPDSVVQLLRNYGFTQVQISKIARIHPTLIVTDPNKILVPKLEFFHSIGACGGDLAKIVTTCPVLLSRSLEDHIRPCYEFLKNSVHLSDELIVKALERSPRAFNTYSEKYAAPNIELLRNFKVPESTIRRFTVKDPDVMFLNHLKFMDVVKRVNELEFDPSRCIYMDAVRVLSRMKASVWEYKFEVFSRWGWSKEETLSAFKKRPYLLALSDEKITKVMEFLLNKNGWQSDYVLRFPIIIQYNLEKRIVPRFYVVEVLKSKGLIKKSSNLISFLSCSETCFIEKFVTKFQETVPQLLDVYQGKINLLDMDLGPEKAGTS